MSSTGTHLVDNASTMSTPAQINSPEGPVRDSEFYFEGGLVVLALGPRPTLFRILRSILKTNSKIFRDMFDLPPADNMEGGTDENPIHLPDDPAAFAVILRHFHPATSYSYPMPEFDLVLEVLRVATKYEFERARNWARRQLRHTWGRSSPKRLGFLSAPTRELTQNAIKLTEVARVTRSGDFIPLALYFLCAVDDMDWMIAGDTTLSQADTSMLWKGSRCLLRAWGRAERPEWSVFLRSDETTNEVLLSMGFKPQAGLAPPGKALDVIP
ncbi:hypothetical protein BOTBODRAFT_561708 [Botryobasidium botryosum FD-172 SS1]|uniref:BTB domain-containing protein n=1 Tax=Botryobasidium botryosum (strain FD-172 SS1) TaxID=930990 RepID=A0A067M1K6_BOTB1|nr:hypothetical protein BOTBODRAFT_561708 [Botryobasidium botryosum FD-172 SS1]